jgi:hypothetical protein
MLTRLHVTKFILQDRVISFDELLAEDLPPVPYSLYLL